MMDEEDKKRKDRKREEKDDDEIAGEELEEQLRMEADREQRRLEMQSIPEDTLDYVEDQDMEEDDDKDDHDQERDDDDDTSATSEEKVGNEDRPGEGMLERKKKRYLSISKRKWRCYANVCHLLTDTALKNNCRWTE